MVKWISTKRDRLSAKYRELHKQLKRELTHSEPEPDKRDRKRQASQAFRAGQT